MLFFPFNPLFSNPIIQTPHYRSENRAKKSYSKICKFKENPYLCNAIEKQNNSNAAFMAG